MKKKALLLTSMVVLACTVGVTALAVGGANQLDTFAVKASPTEYSVTFTESNTTVETVGGSYAICTTTASGNKVGVVGYNAGGYGLDFHGYHFELLQPQDPYHDLAGVGAEQFSHITGFVVKFTGNLKSWDEFNGDQDVESGEEYTGLSITPSDDFYFFTYDEVEVQISSLTIWYSC